MFGDYDIPVSVNNIIGFPDETREQVFETINMNRRIRAESFGAYVFQPYHGTALRDYCIEKGYISKEHLSGNAHADPALDMPQLSKEEITGLQKTFALYVNLPEKYFDDIKIAEKSDREGNKKFQELAKLYAGINRKSEAIK